MPEAAGVIFLAPGGLALFTKRSAAAGGEFPGAWSVPFGGKEGREKPEDTARREAREETGHVCEGELERLGERDGCTTFVNRVGNPFIPELNAEHTGYAWAPFSDPPQPVHPALAELLPKLSKLASDSRQEPEHVAEIHYDGDFDLSGSVRHLHRLGAVGASRNVNALDEDDKPVPFNWDGDGADKIHGAKVDGIDILKEQQASDEYVPIADVKVDRTHGVKWLTVMSRDGRTLYADSSIEPEIEIEGARFDPVEGPLKRHEHAEFTWMAEKRAEFVAEHGREPDDEEREAIYLEGHEKAGTPAERAWFAEQGYADDVYEGYQAWARGKLAKLENSDPPNPPDDPDVKPHGCHGKELELAGDVALAFDRAPDSDIFRQRRIERRGLAFDYASARTYDEEGRLHVATSNISKANICPYLGREIPGSEEMGLEPDRIYQLLRDPAELEKAADTFNRLPILSKHVPVSARDHQPDLVIGATGSDASFEFPYLKNSLVFWAGDAIKDIEDEVKNELSCAYRYRADMTPGTFEGAPYDGVMREIRGNHVAHVKEGRAGEDVVVGDEQPQEINMAATNRVVTTTVSALMAHGALLAHIRPKLAADAKLDFKPLAAALSKVTVKSGLKPHRAAIVQAALDICKGKLAKDASIPVEELATVLDIVEAHPEAAAAMPLPVKDADPPPQRTVDALPAFLKEKNISEDDFNHAMELHQAAGKDAEPPPFAKKDDDEDDDEKKGDDAEPPEPKPDAVDKKAMDAAIKSANQATEKRVLQAQRDVRAAERFVRPWIGDLRDDLACDSAEGVYKAALDALGVKTDGVHASAFRTILEMQPKPGDRRQASGDGGGMAQDAASVDSFNKMFPGAQRIGVIG